MGSLKWKVADEPEEVKNDLQKFFLRQLKEGTQAGAYDETVSLDGVREQIDSEIDRARLVLRSLGTVLGHADNRAMASPKIKAMLGDLSTALSTALYRMGQLSVTPERD